MRKTRYSLWQSENLHSQVWNSVTLCKKPNALQLQSAYQIPLYIRAEYVWNFIVSSKVSVFSDISGSHFSKPFKLLLTLKDSLSEIS